MPEKIPFSCTRLHNVFVVYMKLLLLDIIYICAFRFIFQFFTWTSPHYARLSWQLFLLCFSVAYVYICCIWWSCTLVRVTDIYILLLSCIFVTHTHTHTPRTRSFSLHMQYSRITLTNEQRYTMTNLMWCMSFIRFLKNWLYMT